MLISRLKLKKIEYEVFQDRSNLIKARLGQIIPLHFVLPLEHGFCEYFVCFEKERKISHRKESP